MLRLNLFLMAILAINYVHSNVVIQPTEEQTIVPQTLQTAPTDDILLPSNSLSSPDVPLDGPVQTKKQKKLKFYYPVDLIGGPLGCVLLEELEKLGTVSKWYANSNLMTYQTCWRQCLSTRSMFAGLSKGNECLCSNSALPVTTTFGKSDTNCTGSKHQQCGSATCAEYFTLKKNSILLRQSLRFLDDPERWLHKNGWASWVRTYKGEFEHVFSEVLPLSSAIVTYYDCAAHPTAAPGCEDFYLVVTGFEDFIIKKSGVRPINVEWDITFAGQKSNYNETDRLLVRRSSCEWIYKEDEEIKRELLYLNFEFDKRTLVLVDKRDPTTIIRVNDNAYIESTSGVENKFTSFLGKWFNKASDRSFKDYFRGSYECQSDITNPWYQPPPPPPTVPAPVQTVQTL